MNRVLGDYFETLLYKIFVSIDEHTNIAEVGDITDMCILEQLQDPEQASCTFEAFADCFCNFRSNLVYI